MILLLVMLLILLFFFKIQKDNFSNISKFKKLPYQILTPNSKLITNYNYENNPFLLKSLKVNPIKYAKIEPIMLNNGIISVKIINKGLGYIKPYIKSKSKFNIILNNDGSINNIIVLEPGYYTKKPKLKVLESNINIKN